jgi:carboxypeptidase Taq
LILRGGAAAVFSTATTTKEDTATSTSTSTGSTAYQELVSKLETITQLSRVSAVLGYDQQVFMPSSASAERGAQMAALATVLHDKRTDPALLELMKQALTEVPESDTDAHRLLQLERKAFLENERVPAELAAKAASLSASAYAQWIQAKKAKDFSQFSATLQDCFDTAMAIAEAKQGSSEDLYDQMLDEFEVGMSQDRINEIFKEVQDTLVPLIAKVLASSTSPSTKPLKGSFAIDQQQALSETLVKSIGFNSENGRIDVSVHPFTSSMSASDVRITSRFREDEWYQGLAGTIHKGGHAIYEQNVGKLPPLSIDSALSMGGPMNLNPFFGNVTSVCRNRFGNGPRRY